MPSGYISEAVMLSGYPGEVLDTLMSRFLPPYLAAMSSTQRAELAAVHSALGTAAGASRTRRAASSADGPSAPESAELVQDLSQDHEISSAVAAEMLRVGQRQVRKLAERWEGQGLARRVGRVWLIDRVAVEIYRDSQERRLTA